MSYPRNAASPPVIAVGAIYLLADGTIQTTGASARVKTGSGAWGAAAGTLACDSTSGVWTYAPTQGETDAESFLVAVYKSASTSAQVTIATSASATAGYSGVDWGKVTSATSTVNLSGTTISTTQAVASVTARVTANVDQWNGVTVTGMPMPTYTQPAGFLAATFPATVSSFAGGAVASVTGSVGSVTSPVTVGTNNDKTGYSLTQAFPTNFAALGINSSGHVSRVTLVDTTTTNTDMRGTDNAALASAWTSTRAGYLDSVLLAANANRTVQVTGSNHVAADIHELQPAVITSAAFAAGWLTASGTAADYITELQTALGTATNQTAILDRVSFALSALAGNCSTAQTATETYVLSIGGNTYTAAYSGLDGSGNRSTTTLSKT